MKNTPEFFLKSMIEFYFCTLKTSKICIYIYLLSFNLRETVSELISSEEEKNVLYQIKTLVKT